MNWQYLANDLWAIRNDDGSVHFMKMKSGVPEDGTPEFEATVNDGVWASVVCGLSRGGEENFRWYRAMEFHNGVCFTINGEKHERTSDSWINYEEICRLIDKEPNLTVVYMHVEYPFVEGTLSKGEWLKLSNGMRISAVYTGAA